MLQNIDHGIDREEGRVFQPVGDLAGTFGAFLRDLVAVFAGDSGDGGPGAVCLAADVVPGSSGDESGDDE